MDDARLKSLVARRNAARLEKLVHADVFCPAPKCLARAKGGHYCPAHAARSDGKPRLGPRDAVSVKKG